MPKAYLILENGAVFEGSFFGTHGEATGQIVFTTGMAGYLETLTDSNYYGQIVLQTFPLIGNYGIVPADFESASICPRAYIAKYPCHTPSNFSSEGNLDHFLKERGVVGLCDIDTRALTKIIRDNGVMNGKISASPPTETDRAEAAAYSICNAIASVSPQTVSVIGTGRRRVAMLDLGSKRSLVDALTERGCKVWSFPHNAALKDIMDIIPDGILISNGPGDPSDAANGMIIELIKALEQTGITIFGVCLGHQLLAVAKGHSTQKLKFGHRGTNQPVRDVSSGRTYITSQNHGYSVIANNCSFININDGTVEGMDYGNSFSVQFNPDTGDGPYGTSFLFDRFLERMKARAI